MSELRTLKCVGVFTTNRSKTYGVLSPFAFERNKALEVFAGEWQMTGAVDISKCRVIGVECFANPVIEQGQPLGLVVEVC